MWTIALHSHHMSLPNSLFSCVYKVICDTQPSSIDSEMTLTLQFWILIHWLTFNPRLQHMKIMRTFKGCNMVEVKGMDPFGNVVDKPSMEEHRLAKQGQWGLHNSNYQHSIKKYSRLFSQLKHHFNFLWTCFSFQTTFYSIFQNFCSFFPLFFSSFFFLICYCELLFFFKHEVSSPS